MLFNLQLFTVTITLQKHDELAKILSGVSIKKFL